MTSREEGEEESERKGRSQGKKDEDRDRTKGKKGKKKERVISQISRKAASTSSSAIFVTPTTFFFDRSFSTFPCLFHSRESFLLCVHCADNTGAGFFYVTVGENEPADTAEEKKKEARSVFSPALSFFLIFSPLPVSLLSFCASPCTFENSLT